MLRNGLRAGRGYHVGVLNEVLSLNAQESSSPCGSAHQCPFLNEVLSLNAQESPGRNGREASTSFLNEVLSLNAQEYDEDMPIIHELLRSSMKS